LGKTLGAARGARLRGHPKDAIECNVQDVERSFRLRSQRVGGEELGNFKKDEKY